MRLPRQTCIARIRSIRWQWRYAAYVTTSGLWLTATIWFIVVYARVTRFSRGIAVVITGLLTLAMLMNVSSPASFLYTKLTGLRQLTLPWGEQF